MRQKVPHPATPRELARVLRISREDRTSFKRNLRTLRGIFIDCGSRDQYHLHYGARLLSKRLTQHKIPHVYEEFDDTHSDIDYRMDVSLPFLARSLR